MRLPSIIFTIHVLVLLTCTPAFTSPQTFEEMQHGQQIKDYLTKATADAPTTAARVEIMTSALTAEPNYIFRRAILEWSQAWLGPDAEPVLIRALADPDTGTRLDATAGLARIATPLATPALLETAEKDPTGNYLSGCILQTGNARPGAYRALVQIAERHPATRRDLFRRIKAIRTSTPQDLRARDAALTLLQNSPHNYMEIDTATRLLTGGE